MTTVTYTSAFVPPELIAACGCIPQRLGGLCVNSRLSQTEGMCAFTESRLEALAEQTEHTSCAVFATTCDQMRRAFELYRQRTQQPAFLLNVPAVCTPGAQEYYRHELQRLQQYLCSLSGQPFNENRLQHPAGDTETILSGDQHHAHVALIGETVADSIRQSIDELLTAANIGTAFDATGDNAVLPAVQNSTPDDPLTALANRYFDKPAIWRRPSTAFHQWLDTAVAGRGVDGVILFRYIFCDLWHSAAYELKRRQPVPLLQIDLDGSGRLSASAVSRVQAFSEMLR